MESGITNNSPFWQSGEAKEFYELDNAETDILHPFVANIINDFQPASLLDFGCGNGYLSGLIAPSTDVHLYDSNKDFINHLVINTDNKNITALNNPGDIRNNFYDCVVQSAVLMCISTKDELNNILKSNYDYLRPGGHLVIVLTHPCFLQHKYGHYYTSFDHSNFDYLNEGLPYEVFMKNHTGKPVQFTDYNWPLSTIINLMIANKLSIEKIVEHPDLPYQGYDFNKYAMPWMFIIAKKNN